MFLFYIMYIYLRWIYVFFKNIIINHYLGELYYKETAVVFLFNLSVMCSL